MEPTTDPQKLPVSQFAAKIREKYPNEYDQVSDQELVERTVRKHPVYADEVELPPNFRLLTTSSGYENLDSIYEKAARANNVNADLLLEQGRQETINFKPEVMYGRLNSPKGARGAGQFMPKTAPSYGLKVGNGVDERTDPIKSIHAQAKYMRKLLDDFDGDENLALAGYNAGEGAVTRYGNKIPPFRETRDYVAKITGKIRDARQQVTYGTDPTPTNPTETFTPQGELWADSNPQDQPDLDRPQNPLEVGIPAYQGRLPHPQANAGGSVSVDVGELTPINPALGQFTDAGTQVLAPQQRGKGTDDLNRMAAQVTVNLEGVPTAERGPYAIKKAFESIAGQYNLQPEDIYKAVTERADDWKTPITDKDGSARVDISLRDIANLIGEERFIADERGRQAQSRIGLEEVPNITKEEVQKVAGWETRLPAAIASGGGRTGTWLAGIARLTSPAYLAGTEDIANPQFKERQVRAYGSGKEFFDQMQANAKKHAANWETIDDKTWTSEAINIAGGLTSDLPRTLIQSYLPGGIITGMSLDMAGQAAGRGENKATIGKEAFKGALLGSIAKLATPVGRGIASNTGSKLAGGAGTVAFTGAATYPVSRAFGADEKTALKETLYNTLFAFMDAAPVLAGRSIRVKSNEGDELTVEVKPDGTIKETKLAADKPADLEVIKYFDQESLALQSAASKFIEQSVKTSKTLTGEPLIDVADLSPRELPQKQITASPVKVKRLDNLNYKESVETEAGTVARIAPKVIKADEILTSLENGYPAEFQPRDRSRIASTAQINEISKNLKTKFLDDSPKASEGRPLVIPFEIDGKVRYAVVSGNARVAGIKEAFKNQKAGNYSEFVKTKGGKGTNEIYVGILDPKGLDTASFAREANEASVAAMSSSEQSVSDAQALTPALLDKFIPSEDGSIHGAANRDFLRQFIGQVAGKSELNKLIDGEGNLSQEGTRRVKAAIFAKAFGDSKEGLRLIQKFSESTDSNIKRIENALLQNAPSFAAFKQAAKDGVRYKELDIADDIAKAANKFSVLRNEGRTVEEYLKQQNFFGEELTGTQKQILVALSENRNSAKALSDILNRYNRKAEAVGDPNQRGMFEAEQPTKQALFEDSINEFRKANPNEAALLQPDLVSSAVKKDISWLDTPEKRQAADDAYQKAYAEDPSGFGQKARIGESPDIDEGAILSQPSTPPRSRKGEAGFALIPSVTQLKDLTRALFNVKDRADYQRIQEPIEMMMSQHRTVRDIEFEAERLKVQTEKALEGLTQPERTAIVDAMENDYQGPHWDSLSPRQKQIANELKTVHDAIEQYNTANKVFDIADLAPGTRYLFHWWNDPLTGRPYQTQYGEFSKTGPSSRQRSISTYEEGRSRGQDALEMASTNPGEILGKSIQQLVQVHQARTLLSGLKKWEFDDLATGTKLPGIVEEIPAGLENRYQKLEASALQGQSIIPQANGKPLMVRTPSYALKELHPKLDAYFRRPEWTKLDEAMSTAKSLKLSLSFFHGLGLILKNASIFRYRSIQDIKAGLKHMREMDDTTKHLYRNGLETALERDYADLNDAIGHFRGVNWKVVHEGLANKDRAQFQQGFTGATTLGVLSDAVHKNPLTKLIFSIVRTGLKNSYAYDTYLKMEPRYIARAEKKLGRTLKPQELQAVRDEAGRMVVERASNLFSGEDMQMGALEASKYTTKYYFSPEARRIWQKALISPTWQREHMLEFKNLFKSFLRPSDLGPIYSEHIKQFFGVVTMMGVADLFNYFLTQKMDGEGKHLWENPGGKAFSIRLPWNEPDFETEVQRKDGSTYIRTTPGGAAYVRPFKAITEVPEVIQAATEGKIIDKLESKAHPAIHAVAHQFSPQMRDPSLADRASQLAADAAPIAVTNPIKVAKGERNLWDLIPILIGAAVQKEPWEEGGRQQLIPPPPKKGPPPPLFKQR